MNDPDHMKERKYRRTPYIIARLLSHGCHIDARDHHGDTPLLKAAAGEDYGNIYALLHHGADISVQDNRGEGQGTTRGKQWIELSQAVHMCASCVMTH